MTTIEAATGAVSLPSRRGNLALAARFARRDLRGGLSGFGIFIACIALGVAAIVGVAAVSRGLSDGLAREGRAILGGDAAFGVIQREATDTERQWFAAQGTLSSVALVRAMARSTAGDTVLSELKAVDGTYPAQGTLDLKRAPAFAGDAIPVLLGEQAGTFGALLDPVLAGRLQLKPGDTFTVGGLRVQYRADILSEPDKLAGGIGFGPRVIVSQAALRASGLIQPGSLARFVYRITLPPERSDDGALKALLEEAPRRFPEGGYEIRSRQNVSPQFGRNLERFTQFLTLVGLTALLVGGVGVANATRAFVERKRPAMAAMKSLGATGNLIFLSALMQVAVLALLGIVLGLVLGSTIPFLVSGVAGTWLPFPLQPSIYPSELALGVVYGLLTALTFAIWPLGRAHDIPVSALFRDQVDQGEGRPRAAYLALMTACALALAAVAIGFAFDQRIALLYVGIAAASFVSLRYVGVGVMRLAASLPRARSTELRLAIANIHKPGALTPSIVLSLGLGLTLLVALAVIDSSIRNQLSRSLPETAPSFFFIDIPNREAEGFVAAVRQQAPDAKVERTPMMRGRITALKGISSNEIKVSEQASWVLDGDRGITFSKSLPTGSRIVAGEWWAPDHSGEPLVSFGDELARGLGLAVGDTITVNVLGRNITARIANLRTIEWQTLGINFIMVFSPNSFAGAPHSELATLAFGHKPGGAEEVALARALSSQYPAISIVRVKDTLEAINEVVGQLSTAIRGASAIALVSSVLVLAGALAAGHRARVYDAVILKTLGATRFQLLRSFLLEYVLLGLAAAIFGVIAGALAGYAIVASVMRVSFSFDWLGIGFVVCFALVLTIILGLAQTWRILGQKPAIYLRNL